ncbi:MAG: hypothetical protein ACRCTY_02155 [Candidatus Adiutrix sp.]
MTPYDNMLSNAMPHLQVWWGYIIIMIYVAGLACIVSALFKFSNSKQQGAYGKTLLSLLVGVLLLNIRPFLDSLAYTVFNSPSAQSMSYVPPAHEGQIYVQFAVYVVGVVGLLAVARGVLILRRTDSTGNGEIGRALIHFAGGILCVNLPEFLRIIGATLGSEVSQTVNALIGS